MRKDDIRDALESVYGEGFMVTRCAEHLDDNWEYWETQAVKNIYDDMHHAVQMQIWNWFPGGSTAEIAARRVLEAVDGPI